MQIHVNRQVGHPIIALRPNTMIGRSFFSSETSKEDIIKY